MATVWFLHSINFGNANYCRAFDIYVWYCISSWNIRIIWYDTTRYIRHDISMMGYDARMVYYCNQSIISRQYISVLYDVSERYDLSVWHDKTAVWYNIPSQACVAGIMTFRCFDPSVCWPFGAPVFGVSAFGVFTKQCSHIEEIIATGDFEQQNAGAITMTS